jgi:hypothetical protein
MTSAATPRRRASKVRTMIETSTAARRLMSSVALSAAALACAFPALAQDGEPRPKVSDASVKSPNATINLVNLLVKNGVLTAEQASDLIRQAEDEAYVARQAARDANAKAEEAARQAGAAAAAASPPGTKRVTYVPEVVKREIRDEIRKEVMAKAEKEGWASPGKYPEWASRIRFSGDLRGRFESIGYPQGNDPGFVNFAGINSGSPYDVSANNPNFPPTFNTSKDRERFRLRARLGLEADVTQDVTAGVRFATGENNSPVSTNQSFGSNGGNFSKYALWVDRAFLSWQFLKDEVPAAEGLVSKDPVAASSRSGTLLLGRFDSPFFAPTELQWDNDLGFDGVAVKAAYEVREGVRPFVVAGAFPIFNTDLNAGFNLDPENDFQANKSKSADRYLFGGQIGVDAKISEDYAVKLGASYFDFSNVEGKLSSPCFVQSSADVCDTDLRRPLFAQKGNTYRALRNIAPFPGNGEGAENLYQYYGLASKFRTVSLAGQIDFGEFDPIHVVLDGEYIKNVAFDKGEVGRFAENNRGPDRRNGKPGKFEGGDTGWTARLTVGHKEIKQLWDWNAHVGYRHLESDATMDAFTDSDFGLGGTNLKGYMVGGSLGLADNVWATARWMSADNIAGAPYAVDILQLDLNARF